MSIPKMMKLWSSAAKRDPKDLIAAIGHMTDDPIAVADLIAEAGQKDESLAVPPEIMDEINAEAVG